MRETNSTGLHRRGLPCRKYLDEFDSSIAAANAVSVDVSKRLEQSVRPLTMADDGMKRRTSKCPFAVRFCHRTPHFRPGHSSGTDRNRSRCEVQSARGVRITHYTLGIFQFTSQAARLNGAGNRLIHTVGDG